MQDVSVKGLLIKCLITNSKSETSFLLNFMKLSDTNDKIVNYYFKNIKAQYWQLKNYIDYCLENETTNPPWAEIYEDWR